MAVFIISYVPPSMPSTNAADESGVFARGQGAARDADERDARIEEQTDDWVDSETLTEIERACLAAAEAERAAAHVADSSRSAALAFLAGVRRGWGKRALAEWLLGAYTDATSFAPRGERISRLEAQATPLDEEVLIDLMLAVQAQVSATLALMVRTGTRPWFVDQAIERGHVVAAASRTIESEPEGELWLPRDRPGMRLGDRVLALFACDYLARPVAFQRDLYICQCETITFDGEAKSRGACRAHERRSGVVAVRDLLGDDFTVPSDEDEIADTEPTPFLLKRKAALPY